MSTPDTIHNRIEELRKSIQTDFATGAQGLVDALNLESFGWDQYTPYFNDGDECVFSVRCDYPYVNGERYYSDNVYHKSDQLEEYKRRGEIETDIRQFLRSFSEDDLYWIFGDHTHIEITRNGIKVSPAEHE